VTQIERILAGDRTAGAQQQPPEIHRKLLLHQDLPIPGYQVVVSLVEIPAGMSEVRHTHPGRSRITVTEGTLILETAGRPRTTHKAGDHPRFLGLMRRSTCAIL
jgi:quercetin dioxygenase-like cupin family protein